jgi:hypothetical protein
MPESNSTAITYVVSEFRDDMRWHNVLTTRDEAEARALLEVLGDKGRLEQFGRRKPKLRR